MGGMKYREYVGAVRASRGKPFHLADYFTQDVKRSGYLISDYGIRDSRLSLGEKPREGFMNGFSR